jgi:hypothetical protein
MGAMHPNELLKRLGRDALARDGNPPPPWRVFPEFPAGHLGWRMGPGEDYLDSWWRWVAPLPISKRRRYLEQLAPIPRDWQDAVMDGWLLPVDGDEASEEELEAAYVALRIEVGE